jgi:hypothetical protein
MTNTNIDSHCAFTGYFFKGGSFFVTFMKLSIETGIRSKVIFDKTVSCTSLYFFCSIIDCIHVEHSHLKITSKAEYGIPE